MVELIVSKRDIGLFRYSLDNGTVTIGRSPDNEIYLNSPSVSHQHARISLFEDTCSVVNLDPNGATLVNDKETKHAELHDKDVIQVGHYKITCSFDSVRKPTNIDSARSAETRLADDKTEEPSASIPQADESVEQVSTAGDVDSQSGSADEIFEHRGIDDETNPLPIRRDDLEPKSEEGANHPLASEHNQDSFSSAMYKIQQQSSAKEIVPPLHGTGIDVLEGPAQGKRIYFTRDSAALGVKDVAAVVIKSVEDGYIAQAPNEEVDVTLNGDAIHESPVQLDNGDLIAFSNLSARFFIENGAD